MNRVTIIGRVGRDPEAREFSNGGRVVSFSVATSERWKDKSGERKEKTAWHNIQIFNENLGKIAEQYLRKGSEVAIEGQIEYREYTDKDGNQRKATEIVVPRFGGSLHLIGGKPDGAGKSENYGMDNHAGNGRHVDLDDSVPFAPEIR